MPGMPGDFDPWELFEVVEVNAKKKKRGRCRLCGEQWWDIGPSLILERMGFIPGWEVQQKYGKCAKLNDPENSVWREECAVSTRTRCAWRTRRRPPSCKAGSRSSRLRTRHSNRAA
jgi:hypothetical protein